MMLSLWREGWKLGCSQGAAAKLGDFNCVDISGCHAQLRGKGFIVGMAGNTTTVTFNYGNCSPTCRVYLTEQEARRSYG